MVQINRSRGKPKLPNNLYCKHCKLTNHTVKNCLNLGKDSYRSCGKYGHAESQCCLKNANKYRHNNNYRSSNNGRDNKQAHIKEIKLTNNVEESHMITFNAFKDTMCFLPADERQHFNFDSDNVYSADVTMNNKHIIYYNWITDSVTTSYIYNMREASTTYYPIDSISITGIGNAKAHVKGHRSIEI
jgi:hypothetical protein